MLRSRSIWRISSSRRYGYEQRDTKDELASFFGLRQYCHGLLRVTVWTCSGVRIGYRQSSQSELHKSIPYTT